MATIEVRGYVNFAETKTAKGSGKAYNTFSLGMQQKERAFGDKPESVTYANFQVTDRSSPLPANKAYVEVKGYFKVREYVKDGQKRQALEINATSVEDLSNDAQTPADSAAPGRTGKPPVKEPWE